MTTTTAHVCPHRGRLPVPCVCGEAVQHVCDHCHDDPPPGHVCPCCGAETPL